MHAEANGHRLDDLFRSELIRPEVVLAGICEELPEPSAVSSGPDPLLRRVIAACRERLPGKPGLALDARLSSARKLLGECLGKHGVDVDLELA